MLRTRFLQDPLTFRHALDVAGCITLTDLMLKCCGRVGPYPTALSLMCRDGLQDRSFVNSGLTQTICGIDESAEQISIAKDGASDELTYLYPPLSKIKFDKKFPLAYNFDSLSEAENLDEVIDVSWRSLDPNGIFITVGYFGQRAGLAEKDMNVITSLLSSVPPSLLSIHDSTSKERIQQFVDEVKPRHAGGAVEAALESRFNKIETITLGSLFTYLLWRFTLGRLSYESDANVSFILMAQSIELRLIQERLLHPTLKLIIARKRSDSL